MGETAERVKVGIKQVKAGSMNNIKNKHPEII